MDPEFEYAYLWLRGMPLYLKRPIDLTHNRRRIAEIEDGRPGFSGHLRQVALDALASDDWIMVHKAIAALAIVGERYDVPRIEAVASAHRKAAGTAIFEIEHAPAAG